MMHTTTSQRPKTLGEGAVCFGCAAALLFIAAVATQWLFSLLP
jgi:hypothetical protein